MSGLLSDREGGLNGRERWVAERSAFEVNCPASGHGAHGRDGSGRDRDENGRVADGHGGSAHDLNGHDEHVRFRVGGIHENGSNDRGPHDCVRRENVRRGNDRGAHAQKPIIQLDLQSSRGC